MFSLCEPNEVIRKVFRVSQAHNSETSITDVKDLRTAFLNFLEARQSKVPINRSLDFFIQDSEKQKKLSDAFLSGALNDLNQEDVVGDDYDQVSLEKKTRLVRSALIDAFALNEDLAFVFGLVIHSIFVRRSKPSKNVLRSHGGSSSASIGSIWLAVGDEVTHLDLVEMLIHEMTHHLMFLDELNFPQFNYEQIVLRENYARSAILRRQRPLDKVIHSIAVGASIVDARSRYLKSHRSTIIHPSTEILKSDTRAAINSIFSLSNIDSLITAHTRRLMEECSAICE